MEISEKDKEKLEIFSKYMRSMGCKKGQYNLNIYEDGYFYPNGFFDVDKGRKIDLYPIIEDFFQKITNDEEKLLSYFDDLYDFNMGEINIVVDAIEKTIGIELSYAFIDSECSDYSHNLTERFANKEEQSTLAKFFESKFNEGNNTGILNFNGGGDSGWIEDNMELDGDYETAPEDVLDLCYDLLQSYYPGWEINEGSQGSFTLDFKNKKIMLEFCLNIEKFDDLPRPFTPIYFGK